MFFHSIMKILWLLLNKKIRYLGSDSANRFAPLPRLIFRYFEKSSRKSATRQQWLWTEETFVIKPAAKNLGQNRKKSIFIFSRISPNILKNSVVYFQTIMQVPAFLYLNQKEVVISFYFYIASHFHETYQSLSASGITGRCGFVSFSVHLLYEC